MGDPRMDMDPSP